MNILVIASADATNLSIENIIKEFVRRNHKVEVYGMFDDYKSNRMFINMELPVHQINELTTDIIAKYDIAFCGTDAMRVLRWADIYVFNYNFIFINRWPSEGSDFMFTICKERFSPMRMEEDCSVMPIGDPKGDFLEKKSDKNFQKILYIDAGHFPFGKKGKYQIANMLLDICNNFPEYEIVVKPRWLRADTNITHRSTHLYLIIDELTGGNVPNNLKLLDRHLDLAELIDDSICVITTSYSTYLDVALRGKNVLIVGGLDSEEQYEMRKNVTMREMTELAANTGCLVNYKEIIQYLPKGLPCKKEHLDKLLAYQTDVSERIVNAVEWIYEHFIKYGRFPKIKKYDYETYQQEMVADESLNWEMLKRKRIKNGILNSTRCFDWIDANLNYSNYYEKLNEKYMEVQVCDEGYIDLYRSMENIKNEIIIAEYELLMNDSINQSLLFKAFYEMGLYDCIENMNSEYVLAQCPYNYYMGLIREKQNASESSLKYLCSYLEEVCSLDYAKYIQSTTGFVKAAFTSLCRQYDGHNISANKIVQLFSMVQNSNIPDILPVETIMNRFYKFIPSIGSYLAQMEDTNAAIMCMFWYTSYLQGNINTIHKNVKLIQETQRKFEEKLFEKRTLSWYLKYIKENGVRYVIRKLYYKVVAIK